MLLDKHSRAKHHEDTLTTLSRTDRKVYELIKEGHKRLQSCEGYHEGIFSALKEADKKVYELIAKEYERLGSTLQLIAAENQCSMAVLAALGSVVQNKTTEGC